MTYPTPNCPPAQAPPRDWKSVTPPPLTAPTTTTSSWLWWDAVGVAIQGIWEGVNAGKFEDREVGTILEQPTRSGNTIKIFEVLVPEDTLLDASEAKPAGEPAPIPVRRPLRW